MIHLITGIPGSGKSVAAEYLAQHLPAPVLEVSTDQVREWLFDTPAWGDFPPHELEAVYRAIPSIVTFAARAQPNGHYIIHGTYRSHAQRHAVASAAREVGQDFKLLWVTAPVDVAAARADKRNRETNKGHHARSVRETAALYEEPRDATALDNAGDLAALHRQLDDYLRNLPAID